MNASWRASRLSNDARALQKLRFWEISKTDLKFSPRGAEGVQLERGLTIINRDVEVEISHAARQAQRASRCALKKCTRIIALAGAESE